MPLKPKHLLIGGGAFLVALMIAKSARAVQNLVVLPKVGIPTFQGITRMILPLDTLVQNPTNGTLKFTFPHVQLLLDGSPVAVSASRPYTLELPAHREIGLRNWLLNATGEAFDLVLDFGAALFAAPTLLALATGSVESVKLVARISTTAFLPGLPDGKLVKTDHVFELKSPISSRN